MTDPQSETNHVKFAYIDTQIYIYLYVEKIPHMYTDNLAKKIMEILCFFREIYTIDGPILLIEGPRI